MASNKKLLAWVNEMAKMCQPDNIYWCDGSQEENDRLLKEMVKWGGYTVKSGKTPRMLFVPSHPSDVARVEDRTFIAFKK